MLIKKCRLLKPGRSTLSARSRRSAVGAPVLAGFKANSSPRSFVRQRRCRCTSTVVLTQEAYLRRSCAHTPFLRAATLPWTCQRREPAAAPPRRRHGPVLWRRAHHRSERLHSPLSVLRGGPERQEAGGRHGAAGADGGGGGSKRAALPKPKQGGVTLVQAAKGVGPICWFDRPPLRGPCLPAARRRCSVAGLQHSSQDHRAAVGSLCAPAEGRSSGSV